MTHGAISYHIEGDGGKVMAAGGTDPTREIVLTLAELSDKAIKAT